MIHKVMNKNQPFQQAKVEKARTLADVKRNLDQKIIKIGDKLTVNAYKSSSPSSYLSATPQFEAYGINNMLTARRAANRAILDKLKPMNLKD